MKNYLTAILTLLLCACAPTLAQTKPTTAPTTATVSGTVVGGPPSETVFLDANNNGVINPGEYQTVAVGGTYSFPSVARGNYIARQVLPAGYTQKSPVTLAGAAQYGLHFAVGAKPVTLAPFVDSVTSSPVAVVNGIPAVVTFLQNPAPPAPCTINFNVLKSFAPAGDWRDHKTTVVVEGPSGVVCNEPSPMVAFQVTVAGTYNITTTIDDYATRSSFTVPAGNWTTYYYDAIAGSDTNKGTLATAPRKSISGLTPPANSIHLLQNGPGELYPVSSSVRFVNPNVIISGNGPTTRPVDLATVKWVGPAGPGSIFITDQRTSDTFTVENLNATSIGKPDTSGAKRPVLAGSAVLCNVRGTNASFVGVNFDTLDRFLYLINGTNGVLVKDCTQTTIGGVRSQVIYAEGASNVVIYGNQFVDSWVESPLRWTVPNGLQDSVVCNNHLSRDEPGKAIVTTRHANNVHFYGNFYSGDNDVAFDQPDYSTANPNPHPGVGDVTNCLFENETLTSTLQIRPGPQGCDFWNCTFNIATGPAIGIADYAGFRNVVRDCAVNFTAPPTASVESNTAVEWYTSNTTTTVSGITVNAASPAGFTLSSKSPAGVSVTGTINKVASK